MVVFAVDISRRMKPRSTDVLLSREERTCADHLATSPYGQQGHRTLLHLRLRGSEFNDGDQSNQNEDGQHSGLRDREGWFGLRRSKALRAETFTKLCTTKTKTFR